MADVKESVAESLGSLFIPSNAQKNVETDSEMEQLRVELELDRQASRGDNNGRLALIINRLSRVDSQRDSGDFVSTLL